MQEAPQALPPAVTVIAVLENVRRSQPPLDILIQCKQKGNLVAADDFESRKDVLNVADIIKADALRKNTDEIAAICEPIKTNRPFASPRRWKAATSCMTSRPSDSP